MSQTIERRDAPPAMSPDYAYPPSLPPTVAQRRNARLRAAALKTIPLALFLVLAALRAWQPDLVPFGAAQAEYVVQANARAPGGIVALFSDPTVTPLMMVHPLLRELPQPVIVWVILRGLLDALGAMLLFLAARTLVGGWGGALAALLYGLNTFAWAAVRDPAGPLTAPLMAGSLYAGVRLVQRPTLLHGAFLGLLLGVLARGGPAGLIVVPMGAMALALGRAHWKTGGVMALALIVSAGPALYGWVEPLDGRAVTSGYVLGLPAWLMEGHAYAYLGGALQRLPERYEVPLPWFPTNDPTARHALAWSFSPVTVLLLVAAVAGVLAFRRSGRPALLLPIGWTVLWLIVAYPRRVWDIDGSPTDLNVLLQRAGPLGLVPLLAMSLCLLVCWRRAAVRWVGVTAFLLLVFVGVFSLQHEMVAATMAEWQRQPFDEPSFEMQPSPGPILDRRGALHEVESLREMQALGRTVDAAARRAGGGEIVRTYDGAFAYQTDKQWSVYAPGTTLRNMPSGVLPLPLERETAYLIADASPVSGLLHRRPVEIDRPSSELAVVTPSGADTGARVVTLRPRIAADWLSQAIPMPAVRFADGSALLGAVPTRSLPGRSALAMYWELPAAADGRTVAEYVRVQPRGVPTPRLSMPLPAMVDRRWGELTVVIAHYAYTSVAELDAPVVVTLLDGRGTPIQLANGSTELELPLRFQPRCDSGPPSCP